MLRPNNNQLYSYYVSLLIPTEYLQYYLQYKSILLPLSLLCLSLIMFFFIHILLKYSKNTFLGKWRKKVLNKFKLSFFKKFKFEQANLHLKHST